MPHKVLVNVDGVDLPNGLTYTTGQSVVLTDPQFAQLGPAVFTDGTLTDQGAQGGGAVSAQAADVANVGALTSSQNATANAATQTGAYVQADVQSIAALANALKVSYNAAQVDIATLRTALNTLLTNMRVSGGPMI